MKNIEKILDLDIADMGGSKESEVEISLSKFGGETFVFPIHEIDNETQARILETSFSFAQEDGKTSVKLHMYEVAKIAILNGCPIFMEKKYRDKFKVKTGQHLIDKMLTVNEAVELSEAIQNLSDAEVTNLLSNIGELKEEVKNK